MPRNTRNRSGNPSTLPASGAPATFDAVSLAPLLESLDRLRTLIEHLLTTAAPPGILDDYVTPAELASAFHIKQSRVSEWKRVGFGPPRTRVGQLVVYRREAVRAWLRTLEEGQKGSRP